VREKKNEANGINITYKQDPVQSSLNDPILAEK
jgi:hypothetical protein